MLGSNVAQRWVGHCCTALLCVLVVGSMCWVFRVRRCCTGWVLLRYFRCSQWCVLAPTLHGGGSGTAALSGVLLYMLCWHNMGVINLEVLARHWLCGPDGLLLACRWAQGLLCSHVSVCWLCWAGLQWCTKVACVTLRQRGGCAGMTAHRLGYRILNSGGGGTKVAVTLVVVGFSRWVLRRGRTGAVLHKSGVACVRGCNTAQMWHLEVAPVMRIWHARHCCALCVTLNGGCCRVLLWALHKRLMCCGVCICVCSTWSQVQHAVLSLVLVSLARHNSTKDGTYTCLHSTHRPSKHVCHIYTST